MTVELIDGRAGKPHIGGDDLGNFKAGFAGTEGYVLKTENQLAATLESANSLVINTGAAIMPDTGRHVRITAPETLTIQSGTQGQNRNDLVVLRATTSTDDNTTVETAALVVIKGTATTSTATDPDIQDGDLVLYRVSLSGVSVSTPVALFSVLTPLADLQSSVDQTFFGNSTQYVSVEQTIASSDTYTTPVKGIYVLYSNSSNSEGLNAWWYIANTGGYLCGGVDSVLALVPLQKGTVIRGRNASGLYYEVFGYYPCS